MEDGPGAALRQQVSTDVLLHTCSTCWLQLRKPGPCELQRPPAVFADHTHLGLAVRDQGFHLNTHVSRASMDSIMSLGAPLKQFTSCLSGKKPKPKRGETRAVRRSSFSRRRSISRRRSLPCSSQKVPDSWLRVYQEELKRER